jgi:hypothetical protein
MNILAKLAITSTFIIFTGSVHAQSEELQQLILNVEKLNQLRQILSNMYKGYTILEKGYNTIKDISQGNFNMHKAFLDGLLEVSSTVRNYKRIVEIISIQQIINKEYKASYKKFRSAQVFNSRELDYMHTMYTNLVERTLKNMEELLMIITSGQLRANDAERLNAIDRIYAGMQEKLQFLRHFNSNTTVLALQRHKELKDINDLKTIYGIKK